MLVIIEKLTWLPGPEGRRVPCQPGERVRCSPGDAKMLELTRRATIIND